MKDRVFVGTDVEDAIAAAAASLGLPRAELRYVVLEAGGAAGRGLSSTPARIAVLIQDPRAASRGPVEERRPAAAGRAEAPVNAEPADVPGGVRAVVRAVAEAGGLVLDCEIEQAESALLVRLLGPGASFFHGEDGKGEPLRALEHLLHRMYHETLRPRTLRLDCEGYRERRDHALGEEARSVAASVRSAGEPRALEPMNAYERRIVHVALQDEPGIRTFSVGEGAGRRVTIAPVAPGPADEPGSGAEPEGSDGR